MKKIYVLFSSSSKYSSFTECTSNENKGNISYVARRKRWQPFSDEYSPPKLVLRSSDDGRKNYKFDISTALRPFYIFSDKSVEVLGDILSQRGQFLEVEVESKRSKFIGYYPTKTLFNCMDMNFSEYQEAGNGLIVRKPVLIHSEISDDFLFTIQESISHVFVTEEFKKIVEKNNLKGFDFSKEILTV